MSRPTRSVSLVFALGLGLMLVAPTAAWARAHKNPCAPAPTAGCHGKGLKLSLPKIGHGCGLKMPKLAFGHRKAAKSCEPVVHAAAVSYAPTSAMPYAPVPSHQQGLMPGYGAPGIGMPSAPGLTTGYGIPMHAGFGIPAVPGM